MPVATKPTITFILFTLLFTTAFSVWGSQNILILHSYHKSDWTDNITSGIIDTLGDTKDLQFDIEYMDTKKAFSQAYFTLLNKCYKLKYASKKYAVIITSDDNAFDFASQNRSEIFNNSPIIFCGVNRPPSPEKLADKPITGVLEKADFISTLSFIKKALPDVKQIYAICDHTKTGQINKQKFCKDIEQAFPDLKYELWTSLSYKKLIKKLSTPYPNSAIFFISSWKDADGTPITPAMLQQAFTNSKTPIFGRSLWMIGKGIIGGKCVRGYNQGKSAALLAKQILQGQKINTLPIIKDSPNQFIFDYNQLAKFNLSNSQLPDDSIVLNSPSSVYQIHKSDIYIIMLASAILLCLMTSLIFTIIFKHKANESFNSYQDFFNSVNDSIFIHDAQTGKILDVNQKMLDEFCCQKKEIAHLNVGDLSAGCPPYDQEHALQIIQRATEGNTQVFEWHAKKRTGELFWVEGSLRQSKLNGKNVIIVTVRDIECRKKAEEELRQSEMRFRNIVHSCPMGIHLYEVIDDNLMLIDANPAADQLTGIKTQTLLGKKLEDAFPGAKGTEILEKYLEAAQQGTPWQTKNVHYEDAKINGIFDVYAFQTSPGRLAVMFFDVTDQEVYQKTLQASEAKYRTLIETAPDGIAILRKQTIIDCNKAFANFFGVGVSGIIGKTPFDLSPNMQPSGKSSYHAGSEIINTSLQGKLQRYEWLCQNVKGELFELDISLNSIEMDNEHLLIAFARDITEKKKLQEQLKQAQKMESIGKLAGGIAHDFNNMLAGIIGASQLLKKKINSQEPKTQKYISTIEQAAQRTADLTQKLLAFSRKGHQQNINVNISELITQVVSILKHTIDRRINISTSFEKQALYTQGDPAMLQNTILNIAINAKDALTDGGFIKVTTCTYTKTEQDKIELPNGQYAQIIIEDNGIGIPDNIVNNIFDPFFTTKEVGKGTGMGLAAAYGTIKNHKGTITVSSKYRQGSKFNIYLPLICDHEHQDTPCINQEQHPTQNSIPACKRILIVDDEEIVRDTASEMLNTAGYQVTTAATTQEAIDLYKKEYANIALTILDIIMPDMNGIQLYKQLQSTNANVKAIFVSGYNSENTDLKDIKTNQDILYIQKPFNYETLISSVTELING